MGLLGSVLEVFRIVIACAWLALMIFGASVAWNFGREFTKIVIARWRLSEINKLVKEHPELVDDKEIKRAHLRKR